MRPRGKPDGLMVAVLLTMLTALGPISTDLYLPSLPAIGAGLNADVETVQLTLSVYIIAFGLAQLIYGPIADRWGRRPALLMGVGIYFLASVACFLAPTIEFLIAARFAQAIGGCAGPVLARAVIRDVYGRERAARMLAYIGTAMALGPALGPILGGLLQDLYGWRAGFALLTGFGGLALLGVYWLLDETNPHPDPTATRPRRILGNIAQMLRHKEFLGYMATSSAVYSGLFAWISGSSYVFIEVVGLTPSAYGFVFAAIVVGYMSGTQIGGRLVMRAGIPVIIAWGAVCAALSGAAMAVLAVMEVTTVAAILAPMIFYMLGLGLVMPAAMAGAIGPFPEKAGAASALMGFLVFGLAAFSGLLVAALFDGTQRPMALIIGGCGLLSLVFHLTLVRPVARAARV